MALLLGCGDDPAVAPIDGGVDAGGCTGTMVCDGLLLKACDNNVVGAVVADCSSEGGCGNGRCMSPDCATVERERNELRRLPLLHGRAEQRRQRRRRTDLRS